MRNTYAAALLLCLVIGVSAGQTARLSPQAASITENTTLAGHYGNYTLSVQERGGAIEIMVFGAEESHGALVSEMMWLAQNNMLSTKCSLESVPEGTVYCDENGSWQQMQNEASGTGALVVPQPTSEPEAKSLGMPSRAAYDSQAAPEAAPLAAEEDRIGTEQLLQLLGAFLAVLVASYLILQSRPVPMPDAQDERLLANETRAGIMEELSSADKIPTDISNKLGKSKASVVEHLATLMEAGLVERIATPGKKFVYYRLSQKGRQLLLRRAG